MLKSTFRTVLSKLSIPLWLAILLSATVPVLAAQQHRANSEPAAIGPQQQAVEQEPTVEFSSPTYSISESGVSATIEVVLSEAYTDTTTVNVDYAATGGTATADDDYSPDTGTVQILGGQLSNTFTVNIVQDAIDEGTSETVIFTLSTPTNATLGAQDSTTLTITDDDEANIQVSPTSLTVTEGDPPGSFDISLNSQPNDDVTVNLAPNDECTVNPTSVTFTSANWQTAQGVEVLGVEDGVVDGTQQCLVTTSKSTSDPSYSASGVTVEDVDVTVLDGDATEVQFTMSSYQFDEGDGVVNIGVTLSAPVASEVTVNLDVTGGTAVEGTDFTIGDSVTFASNQTTQSFSMTIIDDNLYEGTSETVSVALSLPPGSIATLGTPSSATLTIVDNDAPPQVQFSTSLVNTNEDVGTLNLTVELNSVSGLPVTVDYSVVSGGSATPGVDFTGGTGTATIAAGSLNTQVPIQIIDDNLYEPGSTEDFTLQLAAPSNATLGNNDSVLVRIADNDPRPTVQFSSSNYDVNEGDVSATITVTLSGPVAQLTSVDYQTSNGTATAGTDYTARSGTLTFPSGSTRRTFTVNITDDIIDEDDETVNLTLSNALGIDLDTPSNSVLTIIDNDGVTEIRFASATYSVTESAATATINVIRSGISGFPVTVDYATTGGGSATPDQDYTPVTGTLNFGPNETSKSFQVPIIADQINEPPETVNLELSNASGALLIEPKTAVLTIHDSNETPAVQFSQATYTVDESMITGTVTVTLSVPKAEPVDVFYAAQEGTATLGEDFSTTGGTLTFSPGQTVATFPVNLLPDQRDEPDETVILTLTGAEGADLGQRTSATLIIVDNDPTPTLSFSLSSLIVGETDGTADVPVRLSAASGRTVTVNYATVNGTAIAGSDYVATNGTLTLSPGETSKTIHVPILESLAGEPNETFFVELSAPTNATLSTPNRVTVTIVDGELILFSRFFPAFFYNYALGEPNDECQDAYEIMLGRTYLFAPDDLYDWYRFTLTEPGNLFVEVNNFVPKSGQIGVGKGDTCADAVLLVYDGDPDIDNTFDLGFQEAGHYYVYVANDDEPTLEHYELRVYLESE